MVEEAVVKALADAGTGAAIALVTLVGLYRALNGLGHKFIDAQERQAHALGAQAQALESITASLREFTGRDSSEHREILVLLRFIAQQQRYVDEVSCEHDNG